MSKAYTEFTFKGRDAIVARFTALQSLAEVLGALPKFGASIVRMSGFEVAVLCEAVRADAAITLKELQTLPENPQSGEQEKP